MLIKTWIFTTNVTQDHHPNDPIEAVVQCVSFVDKCYSTIQDNPKAIKAISSTLSSFGAQHTPGFTTMLRDVYFVTALNVLLKIPMWRKANLSDMFSFFASSRLFHVSHSVSN